MSFIHQYDSRRIHNQPYQGRVRLICLCAYQKVSHFKKQMSKSHRIHLNCFLLQSLCHMAVRFSVLIVQDVLNSISDSSSVSNHRFTVYRCTRSNMVLFSLKTTYTETCLTIAPYKWTKKIVHIYHFIENSLFHFQRYTHAQEFCQHEKNRSSLQGQFIPFIPLIPKAQRKNMEEKYFPAIQTPHFHCSLLFASEIRRLKLRQR